MAKKRKPEIVVIAPSSMLYADDDQLTVAQLLRLRIMPLVIGLALGFIISFAVSRFEEVLAKNIEVAFFLPFIVYMAAAVGSQTATIATRDMSSGTAVFNIYVVKEIIIGLILGLTFAIVSGVVILLWLASWKLAMAVALSMFAAISVAPLLALLVTKVMDIRRIDPAAGAGPIATVIQDTISVVIYGLIASAILL